MVVNLYESITLENERIRLIPMQPGHARELHEINHESIWSYMLFQATNEDLMQEWVKSAIELRNQLTDIPFVVVLKTTDEVLGSTRIQHIDYERQSCEIGASWFGTRAQRTFVNSDSKFLLLEYCFEVLNMMRVQIRADERNIRSNRAIERIGFTKEGIIRKERNLRGVARNIIIYSIIDDEWPEVKKNLLIKQQSYMMDLPMETVS
ncbi:GNAT family N-acetyltransferase [Salinicoccus sp. ID82-1]|uniref:GNAT family N-acetyltransferase n=1 Tax=Salinicoccus cyprini TaxID=2493691 RepID=A0A558AZ84_9STAP|nr:MULTISPECIES: GNAT family protein [Salinicoccus]MCG1009138.1 GNAT family N-acetyltransferase [Salinicoccus sp. ID82-1]TVT29582.1 GNAT family N-acetyltransferase [Salinicoccus cyprini]